MDCLKKIKRASPKAKVILLTPQGEVLNQARAKSFSKEKALILIAGHYEGIDERVMKSVDAAVSVGDYILTGGELPAMVLMDCIIRLIPGVLGSDESASSESFEKGLLEYPQYTRPADYKGDRVPDILISGNHKAIEKWRRLESVMKTAHLRPDLIKHIKQLEEGE
jgi:tRNA (guanine37-N1)-methyltransferase